MKKHLFVIIHLILLVAFFIWSLINPHDTYLTWLLEATPVIIVLPILILTWKRFPLSGFLYTLILIHCCTLLYGAHYSYAEAPLGDWISSLFGWERNNYDKFGHFLQGFGPVFYARELLLRTSPLQRGKWLNTNCVSIALAVSAIYEIIEFAASQTNPADTEAFLGTQGYIWDTQTDMLACFIGALIGLICFARLHDRSLKKLLASLKPSHDEQVTSND